MAAVIITKKDLEKLGKELVKELYEFLHNEYILSSFPEMKEEKTKFLRDLVLEKFQNNNYTIEQKENSWSIKHEEFDESKFEDELKCIKDEIEDGSIKTDLIFYAVNRLNFNNDELDEDLYAKAYAFKNLFGVFESDYRFL